MKTIPKFKIRCSAIGKIMTNPRKKGDILSETTKKYLKEWLTEQLYDKRKEIKSKYLEKGINNEDLAIDIACSALDWGFAVKNDVRFTDEFMTGEPDLILDTIEDIKCSWDCFTFPIFEDEIPNKDYYWQLQGYMSLTDKESAGLVYVLTDTPDDLLSQEAYGMSKRSGCSVDLCYNDLRKKHTYEVELKYRVKRFPVYRNQEDIDKIKARVLECRDYLKTLIEKL